MPTCPNMTPPGCGPTFDVGVPLGDFDHHADVFRRMFGETFEDVQCRLYGSSLFSTQQLAIAGLSPPGAECDKKEDETAGVPLMVDGIAPSPPAKRRRLRYKQPCIEIKPPDEVIHATVIESVEVVEVSSDEEGETYHLPPLNFTGLDLDEFQGFEAAAPAQRNGFVSQLGCDVGLVPLSPQFAAQYGLSVDAWVVLYELGCPAGMYNLLYRYIDHN